MDSVLGLPAKPGEGSLESVVRSSPQLGNDRKFTAGAIEAVDVHSKNLRRNAYVCFSECTKRKVEDNRVSAVKGNLVFPPFGYQTHSMRDTFRVGSVRHWISRVIFRGNEYFYGVTRRLLVLHLHYRTPVWSATLRFSALLCYAPEMTPVCYFFAIGFSTSASPSTAV